MKKISFFIFFCLLANITLAQTQLRHLTKTQAQRVVNFLKMNPDVVLYAGCAHKDIARKLKIESVSYQPVAERPDRFEVFIQGMIVGTFDIINQTTQRYVETKMQFADVVDIAYVHIRTGFFKDPNTGKNVWDATCLGIYLGYDCDPCVDPFDYPYISSNEGY